MQDILKNTTKSVTSKNVLQELVKNLENMRNKEAEERLKVDTLRKNTKKKITDS